MTEPLFEVTNHQNHTVGQVGRWSGLDQYTFQTYPGKLFLKNAMRLTGMEVSLNKLPPGVEVPFLHKHRKHEELFIFVKGKGQFQVDGQTMDVSEGTVIRVAPEGVRTWRNNSSEDLYYVVVQANSQTPCEAEIADGIGIDGPVEWPPED